MVTPVTITTMYGSARDALVALIRDNVTDPRTNSTNSRRRWVYRLMPDITAREWQELPFIVVSGADIASPPLTLDQNMRDDTFSFEVQIVTDYNDTDARCDDISNNVLYYFTNSAAQTTLDSYSLYSPIVLSSSQVSSIINQKRVMIRLLRIEVKGVFSN